MKTPSSIETPSTNMETLPIFKKALELGEFWHAEKGSIPKNLADRVKLALHLSQMDLSEPNRNTIGKLIRSLNVQNNKNIINPQDLEPLLRKFEEGEISLTEILDYELNRIEEEKPSPGIKTHIADINNLIYSVLKGFLDGDMRADALTSLDVVIDETRNEDFETAVKAILKQMEENLKDLSNFKEARLTHINPNPEIQEYTVHSNSQKKSDISEHTNINLLEWNKHEDKKLNVNWTKVECPEENETKLLFKLSFGEKEFGYLEYRFEGEKIHPIVFGRCANMSAMVDTFLNKRLQDEVKKIIAQKKREILAENKFSDWPVMCTELCKLLSKVLQKPIAFSCNLKPGESKSWDVLVNQDKVEKDADFIGFTKEALENGGEFFELKIDKGTDRQRIGSIMVACKDDAQRGIVTDVLSFLEGIILSREEARHWLSKLIGSGPADGWLANDIEKTPKPHPVVVLYSDIDDYSKTMQELATSNPNVEGGIDEIMTRFISEAKLVVEKKYNVVLDKFVGDETIVLVGPPYTEKGLDAFGNEKPNFAHNLDLAFEISQELQKILDDCSEAEQKEHNFILPRRLLFAHGCGIVDGDPVGIYGDPEKPGAGVDYTIFGHEMNRVARVLGKADAEQFLIPYDTYVKYQNDGGKILQADGEPKNVDTKGVGEFKVILVKKATK
jgi:class 3 adenylate cyclase